MALRHLRTPPKPDDFTPLQEHQEQTPTTFFGAKPVLYVRQPGLTLSAPASQLQDDAVFAKFSSERENEGEAALVKDVEIWVNSENLILFQNTPSPTGVVIPYPTIALHATMKYKTGVKALLLNISLNDVDTVNADEDISILELAVLPPAYTTHEPLTTCITKIFDAMNTCADLHPDPDEDEEEDLTAPGATGWITAENMDDFVDEDGNFKGVVYGEDLGPGAGTVRRREDDDEINETNGVEGEAHEDKYHRIG